MLGALAEAERTPLGRRTPQLAVLAAEARVCLGRGDIDELELLRDLVAAGDDTTLVLRVEAALAEHHASRGSPVCVTIAGQALAPIADVPLLAADQLWARGRLWRTLALADAFIVRDRPAHADTMLELAKADFREAGFDAEWARSAADVQCAVMFALSDDYEQARHTVVEALASLRQMQSSYVDLALSYRVLLDLAAADLPATHAGVAEIERIGLTRPLHPGSRIMVSSVRALTRLVGDGPTPEAVAVAEDHLALCREEGLPVMAGQLVGLASALVDAGYVEPEHLRLARRWATQATATDPSPPRIARELASLRTRLDLLERGDDAAVAAVDADLASGRDLHLRRDVAQRALRAALAARRVGRHDLAERLYLEAVADLPPPDRRLAWENVLVAGVVALRTPEPPPVRVCLLGPEVEIDIGGARHTVSTAIARLAVALVAEGGAAPADRLIDALWPDTDVSTGRSRLRVALHRLRTLLRGAGPGSADPIRRRGDLVALAPHVDLDVMRFEKLATGNVDERRAAVDLYRGDVAHVQLAYDDLAAPLRRRLVAIWRDIAREALADPDISRARIARVGSVASLGASTDPELLELLRLAEARRPSTRARSDGSRGGAAEDQG